MKKLKGSGIFIYEDFCRGDMELGKSLWEKVLEYRRQGKYAYLNYRAIVVRDKINHDTLSVCNTYHTYVVVFAT